jgi:hypothetical protein
MFVKNLTFNAWTRSEVDLWLKVLLRKSFPNIETDH